jgi:hypothetical protein
MNHKSAISGKMLPDIAEISTRGNYQFTAQVNKISE